MSERMSHQSGQCSLALEEWMRGLWFDTKRYFEALAWPADYPGEEQTRWIAGLEKRIRRVEAALSAAQEAQDRSPHRLTQK